MSAPFATTTATRSLKELAQQALDVQNACNLCGVAQSFAAAMIQLYRQPDCTGTNWVNNHPITRLWVDKLADLSGRVDIITSDNYDVVADLANGN